MKILCLRRSPDGSIRVEAGADSAILRHGEPVFPEERSGGWISMIVPAIRMSRLGTSIRKSRAAEYYDSFTFFHVLWPASGDSVAGSGIELKTSVRALGSETPRTDSIALDPASLDVDNVISVLSEYMTFKTGDIILFFDNGLILGPSEIDTEIKVWATDTEVLGFRIK